MNISVWRVNGEKVDQSIPTHNRMKTIEGLIGEGCSCTDSVNLRDGRMMIVDDNGIAKGLPVNPAATELVQSIYPLYKQFDQKIYGDVVIAIDAGNGNIVFTKRIDWTDFPLPEVTLYCENNTICLPSER